MMYLSIVLWVLSKKLKETMDIALLEEAVYY